MLILKAYKGLATALRKNTPAPCKYFNTLPQQFLLSQDKGENMWEGISEEDFRSTF